MSVPLTVVGQTVDGHPIVVAEQPSPTLSRKGWVGFAQIKGRLFRLPDGRFIRVRCYEDIDLWEALNAEASGTKVEPEKHEVRDGGGEADMSPEAVAERAEAKARMAEALAWVRDYTGSWGLILDIRSDRRWGTAKMRLSERQVEVILAAKQRDAEREEQLEVARINTEIANADDYAAWAAAQAATPVDQDPGLAAQPATRPAPGGDLAPGMYRLADGAIAKVQQAVHGSGQLYAKRLVVEEGSTSGTFVYEPGLIRRIRPEDRLALDEASAFGKLYGWCMVCGRTLTDERSIAAGIGPVCASRV